MTKSFDFSKMIFSPENQSLSIVSDRKEVIEKIDLTKTSVKLQVIRKDRNLHVILECVAKGSLKSDNLEIKTRFDMGGNNAALYFDVLKEKLSPSINDGLTMGADNAYHLFWVGASDLRNNLIQEVPTGLLLMEGKITSFEILNNCLCLRYHDTIG